MKAGGYTAIVSLEAFWREESLGLGTVHFTVDLEGTRDRYEVEEWVMNTAQEKFIEEMRVAYPDDPSLPSSAEGVGFTILFMSINHR